MSYDLLVFDPSVAPTENADFPAWVHAQMQAMKGRDRNAPEGLTGALPQFFATIRQSFPPMNGPFAFDYEANLRPVPPLPVPFWRRLMGQKPVPLPPRPLLDEAFVTDYILTPHAITMSFAWSIAGQVKGKVFDLAMKTGLGFFEVSGEAPVPLRSISELEDFLGL